jgi:hypothetical protein
LTELARGFGVSAAHLTLSSIVERCSADARTRSSAERLSILRRDLRQAASRVARAGRKSAALFRVRRRILDDALAILLDEPSLAASHASIGRPPTQGSLVDAEV